MGMVGRYLVRTEACSRGYVDLAGKRILVVVGSEHGENPCHRKGKGSLTMQISQGLVEPNQSPNWSNGKGKQVNIPVLLKYVWQHKFSY